MKRGKIALEWVLIGLFIFSSILFILSFARKDRTKQLEEQLDNLSITFMQEIYQLKKKMRLLEEELLVGQRASLSQTNDKQALLIEEVGQLSDAGYEAEEIARKTGLLLTEVEQLQRKWAGSQ
ncbi:hypothetical protein AMD02_008995 [Halalkalibacterium halodurans]|uniref:DUF2802 domain-containing protein n=1 Tax=Halalkalibacterium halodurans TaxID=86665 RepID=A0A0M0KLU4_ALKHA|nr:hypothetical protein AMD02_008995 [Halalkalibacterium halodurans]